MPTSDVPTSPTAPVTSAAGVGHGATSEADVIVIGAGVAGLTAARALVQAGRHVVVLEKSRGLGGRCATRRVAVGGANSGTSRLDHGAQFVTARDPRFDALLRAWADRGEAVVWIRGVSTWRDGAMHASKDGHARWAFPRGMNRIGKLLAYGVDVVRETRVERLERDADGVTAIAEGGRRWRAPRAVVATPPEQAEAIARGVIDASTRASLGAVRFAPSFALLAGFGATPAPAWRAAEIDPGPDLPGRTLRWASVDASKRDAPAETTLVAHLRVERAEEWFDAPHDDVAGRMIAALGALAPELGSPRWHQLHRWRYALATAPHPEPFVRDGPLLFVGDWCGGARVESAWQSGAAAAAALGAEVDGDPLEIWDAEPAPSSAHAGPGSAE